jgi:phage protein D
LLAFSVSATLQPWVAGITITQPIFNDFKTANSVLQLQLCSDIAIPMRRVPIAVSSVVAICLLVASPTGSYALTPAQSAVVAAKAKADATTRAKIQASIKARTDAMAAKAKAVAAADAKAKALTRLNVRTETRHRVEAAEKAAKLHRQIVTAKVEPSGKIAVAPDAARRSHHLEGRTHAHAGLAHRIHEGRHQAAKAASSGHGH